MSLDRSHPVFRSRLSRDRTPSRCRVRTLDEEVGSRSCRRKIRRYICILGNQDTGRRSLARRFFQDRGQQIVDGNYWLRGRIPLTHPFPRGELDLLIRIVPSPAEEDNLDSGLRRAVVAAGIHGNAALFIYAFVCARVRYLVRLDFYHELFFAFQGRSGIPSLVVGTKSDLRNPGRSSIFMTEDEIRAEVGLIFRRNSSSPHIPQYLECSVLNNGNVNAVINAAMMHIIMS